MNAISGKCFTKEQILENLDYNPLPFIDPTVNINDFEDEADYYEAATKKTKEEIMIKKVNPRR